MVNPPAAVPKQEQQIPANAVRTQFGDAITSGTGEVITSGGAASVVPPPPPPPAPAAKPSVTAPPAKPSAPPEKAVPAEKPQPAGTGLKPGGGVGLKLPTPSGDDKWVMDMIKKHEGFKTKPYKDSLGLWTIGVGHLIGDGKTLPPEWNRELSPQEVDTLFAGDFASHKQAATKIPGYDRVNEQGKGALIDLTFNMGNTWYKKWPNFVKNLSSGNTEGAAASLEDSNWYKQVKSRAVTIVGLIRNSGKDIGQSSMSVAATKSDQKATSGGTTVVVVAGAETKKAPQAAPRGQQPLPAIG
jgi:lysozyme